MWNVRNDYTNSNYKGIVPVIGEIYTVRQLWGHDCLYVEEIISPVHDKLKIEYPHSIKWYREIQPPISVEDIFEKEQAETEIKELELIN